MSDASIVPGVGPVFEAATARAASLLFIGGVALSSVGTATTVPSPTPLVRPLGSWTTTAAAGTVSGVSGKTQVRERRVVGSPNAPGVAAGGATETGGAADEDPSTQSETVRWVRAQSGLTWEQLGRVFGVSRRAVHLWANGGRMNATNAELLGHFVSLVRRAPGDTPDARRAALLAPGTERASAIDQLRQLHHSRGTDVSGTPFRPEELLGALHGTADDDTART